MDNDTKLAVTSFIRQYGLVVFFGLLGVLFIWIGLFTSNGANETPIVFEEAQEKDIFVDVSGAVISPGVFKLKSNSRFQDAVISAGGLGVDADRDYISKSMNMAEEVHDGQKIYIPFEGEEEESVEALSVDKDEADSRNGLVDLNSASQSELDALPGIGPVTIEKIVDGRPYLHIDELLERGVVGKAQFEKIKDLVSVN